MKTSEIKALVIKAMVIQEKFIESMEGDENPQILEMVNKAKGTACFLKIDTI